MAVVEVRGTKYYMHDGLKSKWDKIKNGQLTLHDEDRTYIVDGREGSGKSLFTIQQAAYIDPTILDDEDGKILPRICFSTEEVLKAIRNTKSSKETTKSIIFDEAFRGISSKAALSKENKKLVSAMMEMRQFNLVLFIVSPSYFLLELYAAMLRSNALFHIIKEKNSKRRYFKAWGYKNKAKMYQIGIRKGWGYPIHTRFKGNFFNIYPSGEEFETKYRQKKIDSHKENIEIEEKESLWKVQRDELIKYLYNHHIKSAEKLATEIKTHTNIQLSRALIGHLVHKTRKIPIKS